MLVYRSWGFAAIAVICFFVTATVKAEAPVASFTASPSQGQAPLTATLDASSSSDSDGLIVKYDWSVNGQPISLSTETVDFDVDNVSVEMVGDVTVTKKTVTITFKTEKTYSIGLTVTDNEGLTDNTEGAITVSNQQAPTAIFTASPTSGSAPLTVTLDPSGSFDSDGTIVQYDWSVNGQPMAPSGTNTVTFETDGKYIVMLTVTDNDGLTGQAQIEINVESNQQAPSAIFTASPTSGSAPLTVTLDPSGSFDPDGTIVQYDWSVNGQPMAPSGTNTVTFETDGKYIVMLTVTDNDGLTGQAQIEINVKSNQPGEQRTLILTNREKVAQLYSPTDADQIISKLNDLANHPDVQGLVIQVESDPTVAAAYAARANDYDDKDKANAVAEAIKQVILSYWNDSENQLENIVIVGDDRVIPFYRIVDGTRHSDTWTLTDDFYTDREPTNCSRCANPEIYVPDLAAGRLIETPSQIMGFIEAFLADNTLNISEAAVVGYDFVQDGAQAHCDTLQSVGIVSNCALIGEHWTSNDFISQILNTHHHITSINCHADYNVFGTPSGSVYASDFADTSTDFSGTLFYTVGCHSGQNVSSDLDLAESLAMQKANYIANTGYGWGCTSSICLSEELMWDLTKQLVKSQTTVGQALKNAKQQYFADHPFWMFSPSDEKIVTESTLYGLPMYQVTLPASSSISTGITVNNTQTTQENGLQKKGYSYTWASAMPAATASGETFYSLNGVVTSEEGKPILPKLTYDVSNPEKTLHGVVFMGGSYVTVNSAPPLQRFKTTTGHLSPVRTFNAPGWYPSTFFTPHSVALNVGKRESLVATAGQYNQKLGQQRIFDQMEFYVYHHTLTNDWTAPTAYLRSSRLNANTATVYVTASDASGIKEIVVAYTDGKGTWNSVNLTGIGIMTWSGSFTANADTEFFIQTVDSAGNVAVNDNEGKYFKPGDPAQDFSDLQFQGLKTFYQVGEQVKVELVENPAAGSRSHTIDLWVAIQLPTGELLFETLPLFSFSLDPQPFKRAMPSHETRHSILEFVVPPGMGGEYTFYALYVAAGTNPLTDGLEAVSRSNLVMQTVTLAN
jgi:PKD repeat protein